VAQIPAAAQRGAGVRGAAGQAAPGAVIAQLSASRDGLGAIAALTDRQLDAIPPKDSFRFCDGQRTVEQVIASLLRHQRHQLDALKAARSSAPGAGVGVVAGCVAEGAQEPPDAMAAVLARLVRS
jgi:hypothetical protein